MNERIYTKLQFSSSILQRIYLAMAETKYTDSMKNKTDSPIYQGLSATPCMVAMYIKATGRRTIKEVRQLATESPNNTAFSRPDFSLGQCYSPTA